MKQKLVFTVILFLLSALNASYGWSEPIMLSSGSFNQTASIIMDKEEVLHAFWAKADTIPGDHGVMKYSYSSDFGENWSEPITITNNQTSRPILPQPVIDSENNIHLVYNFIEGQCWYLKQIDGIWSQEVQIVNYTSSAVRCLINSDDKIYVFWVIDGGQANLHTYYIYKENEVWSAPHEIEYPMAHADIISTDDNILHFAGAKCSSVPYQAYYYNFDTVQNQFCDSIYIGTGESSIGYSLFYSSYKTHIVYISYITGSSTESEIYYRYKNNVSNEWSDSEFIDRNMSTWLQDKQIIVDRNDNAHIFEQDWNHDSIFVSHKTPFGWIKEPVAFDHTGNDGWINGYKVIVHDNICYLIYALTGNGPKIYFKKKTLPVDINEEQVNINTFNTTIYPNPFNNSTNIQFKLPRKCQIQLDIFNMSGELIESLFNGALDNGIHSFNLNGENLSSGVYYFRLQSKDKIIIDKLTLIK
ncbi:MAG: T9SS type A sorting domain-containing protein [Candidatus Delongbacteria bacterium]|nr:T9SS type A sorting domain-containing protein [Candidatus Dojkabacteria bacterium]MBN2836506.1 T9SS type A sorting domain-containing protein [Candidatus Delongbacteria bacterium]